MRSPRIGGWTICLVVLAVVANRATAADFGAVTSGNWNAPSTWTGGIAVPGATDTAYIGSTNPNGAALSATVTLTQNQSVGALFLGYGTGTSGTLNLGNFQFSAGNLYLGYTGGTAAIIRGTGTLAVTNSAHLYNGTSLSLVGGDVLRTVYLSDNSSLTTAAAGNLTNSVNLDSGGTLTLGANLTLTGTLDIRAGTVNAQNKAVSAPTMYVGWFGGPAAITNRGAVTASNLFVANQPFNLTAGDTVTNFFLSAAASAASTALLTGARVQYLELQSGATATTSAAGNIVQGVMVGTGGSNALLTLGAPLTLTSVLDIRSGTVNAQGNAVSATAMYIGWNGGPAALTNRGVVTATNLYVANQPFNLTTADAVTNFFLTAAAAAASTALPAGATVQYLELLSGATATTSAAGNIAQGVVVGNNGTGSRLTLGAPLTPSGSVDVRNGTLDARGYAITTFNVNVGRYGTNPAAQLQNAGPVTATDLYVGQQSQATLTAGLSSVSGVVNLSNGSLLRVRADGGNTAQLSVTNPATTAVNILDTSKLTFDLDGLRPGYVMRWANPIGGNHIADFNALISAGRIDFTFVNGAAVQVNSDASYTYLFQPVPEPATVFGIGAAVLAAGAWVRRRVGRVQPTSR